MYYIVKWRVSPTNRGSNYMLDAKYNVEKNDTLVIRKLRFASFEQNIDQWNVSIRMKISEATSLYLDIRRKTNPEFMCVHKLYIEQKNDLHNSCKMKKYF